MNIRKILLAAAFALSASNAGAYTLSQLVSATNAPATAVFASVAVPAENAPQATQWTRVVQDTEASHDLQACLASPARCPGQLGGQWRAMMQAARGADRRAQLDAVNRFFNRFAYRTDAQLYGTSDHWATPTEFMTRGAGDCEDYAIAKFFSLKLLGFADAELRVVAVFDRIERIGHAVLSASVDGTRYILDNRSAQVFAEARFTQYQPVLAMNETATWRTIQQHTAAAAPATIPNKLGDIATALNFR